MLLKNQKEDTTDYTKDWPARYYDIPTGALRREHLKRAKSARQLQSRGPTEQTPGSQSGQ